MKATVLCLAGLVLAATILGGCTKFTRQNYEMVQRGDSKERVVDVLGKPEMQSSDLFFYRHTKPYYQAKIYFEDNQVDKKEWFDDQNRWVQPQE